MTTDPPATDLRLGMRRLGVGLIVYGVVGLVIAAVGLVALLSLGTRVDGLVDRTSEQVDTVIATLDETAAALSDAGTSAVSFSVTLERTPPTVRQAAQTVGNLQGNLRTVEGQLSSLSILGTRPLADVAALFGQMSSDLDGLDTRLGLIADDLEDNRDALLTNAASLTAMGDRLAAIADDLRGTRGFAEPTGSGLRSSFDDLRAMVTTLALIVVAWAALPAIGALVLGWWLRRLTDGVDPAPPSDSTAPA